jgi:ankyrin repeat protein
VSGHRAHGRLAPPGKELIVSPAPRSRTLPKRPDLNQLKRQAKELLESFRVGDPDATADVHAQYHGADPRTFALHDAQLVVARAYGFESWPKLKAFVERMTVHRLVDAIRARDTATVQQLLARRPELVRMSIDNLHVLHYAVLADTPDVVRLLMAHGANAREGVYPYREATTAHALAVQRGHDEIVRVIELAEQEQRNALSGAQDAPAADDLFRAIAAGSSDRAIALMSVDPRQIHSRHVPSQLSPLHAAAQALDDALVAWLLEHGAEPAVRMHHDLMPLDLAALRWYRSETQRFEAVARLLLGRGAPMTAAAAAALGDTAWLRARHAEAALTDTNDGSGGLLRIAVTHNRPEVLRLLLDCGFDPDTRVRLFDGDDAPWTWGMALQHAVELKRHEMAETLLNAGADPNASIYASGDPISSAYGSGDERMIALLEAHGGMLTAGAIAAFGSVDLALRVLAADAPCRVEGESSSVAEELLNGAARRGEPEIVRAALAQIDWRPDDPRWFSLLEQTLRHDSDPAVTEWKDSPHLTGFRLLLERCDPNLRGRPTDRQQFGLTPLHNIVARGNLAPVERVAFAGAILDKGARLDVRDNLLKSTPLGWACRWGQLPLVRLFLERGADPIEADAESWATPLAWARRSSHAEIEAELIRAGARR